MPLDLQVIAPLAQHREEILDLAAKCFSPHHGYFNFLTYCRQGYMLDSNLDWSASRIGLSGGKIVTHWGVWDYRMRIGRSSVRVAGVGAVATHGDFRKMGLMVKTAAPSLEAMRELGYDMTLLFGISDFYHKFGYVQAWPYYDYVVRAADLPKAVGPALRKYAPDPRADLDRLYNRWHEGLTGTAVRPTYRHSLPDLYGSVKEGYLWGKPGKVAGYVVAGRRGQELWHFDSAGDGEEIVAALARLCRKLGCTEVRLTSLHAGSDLAKALRRLDCRAEQKHYRCGGPMIRTINLRNCLAAILPELQQRLADSAMPQWAGKLLIADPRDKVTLEIARSRIRVADKAAPSPHAIRGGEEIAQLLVGADEPAEIVRTSKTRLSGDAKKLISVLFPYQCPSLEKWDHF